MSVESRLSLAGREAREAVGSGQWAVLLGRTDGQMDCAARLCAQNCRQLGLCSGPLRPGGRSWMNGPEARRGRRQKWLCWGRFGQTLACCLQFLCALRPAAVCLVHVCVSVAWPRALLVADLTWIFTEQRNSSVSSQQTPCSVFL